MRKIISFLMVTLSLAACVNHNGRLKDGVWRGVLTTVTGEQLPFNFMVTDTAGGKQQLCIINGTEQFKVNDIRVLY